MRVARPVGRRIGDGSGQWRQSRLEQVGFHFVPTDINQQVSIDLDTRRKALPAPFYYLRAEQRVFDDIAIFVSQIVFAHNGAHALAPAAGRFQVGRDGGYTAQVADECVVVPIVNEANITPHTEAFQAVVWHLLVAHPLLLANEMKWESVK